MGVAGLVAGGGIEGKHTSRRRETRGERGQAVGLARRPDVARLAAGGGEQKQQGRTGAGQGRGRDTPKLPPCPAASQPASQPSCAPAMNTRLDVVVGGGEGEDGGHDARAHRHHHHQAPQHAAGAGRAGGVARTGARGGRVSGQAARRRRHSAALAAAPYGCTCRLGVAWYCVRGRQRPGLRAPKQRRRGPGQAVGQRPHAEHQLGVSRLCGAGGAARARAPAAAGRQKAPHVSGAWVGACGSGSLPT